MTSQPTAAGTVFAMPPPNAENGSAAIPMPPPDDASSKTPDEKTALNSDGDKAKYTEESPSK